MKLFRESLLILIIYFICDGLSKMFKLPIPGNIIGMILMFILLMTGFIKRDKIATVSEFFLDHLAFFFIPAGVGLMNSFASISNDAVKIVLICIITTIIVMSVTGLTIQIILKASSKNKKIK